jgi:hypothetical protein
MQAGNSRLRPFFQFFLVMAEKDDGGYNQNYGDRKHQQANRTRHPLYLLSQQVSPEAEYRCPANSSQRVHKQEVGPPHQICSSEKGR